MTLDGKIDCISEMYDVIPEHLFNQRIIDVLYKLYIGVDTQIDYLGIQEFYNDFEDDFGVKVHHGYISSSEDYIMGVLRIHHRYRLISEILS